MSRKVDPYLRLPAVVAAVGLSGRTIYRRVKSGDFPAPKSLGGNAVGWRTSDVFKWMDSRPSAASAAPENFGEAWIGSYQVVIHG